jgi:hypothetical protein
MDEPLKEQLVGDGEPQDTNPILQPHLFRPPPTEAELELIRIPLTLKRKKFNRFFRK